MFRTCFHKFPLPSPSQRIRLILRPYIKFRESCFLRWGVVSALSNTRYRCFITVFTRAHHRCFITMFTRAHHRCLSWARRIQSKTFHSILLRSIVILPFHLCLGLLRGLFPSGFLTKILCAFPLSYIRSYRMYPEAVSSIRNPRICQAVVSETSKT